ncbi:MAG: SAM-dependent chlorinase/fluorinase, partial [Chloroflexi bacterium]|nr:SAM-dependent chlorinase/fluorinase [Chloroflexota bacterium]
MPPIITLLTDFGLRDGYVAAMKGVILSLAPEAVLVDISHDLPPQDVTAAAFVLASCWQFFPEGTIHLAVVDPGVGSNRRAVAVAAQGHSFVTPDNGLLS